MKNIYLIVFIVFVVLVIIVAFENFATSKIPVFFFTWMANTPLTFPFLGSAIFGFLAGIFFTLYFKSKDEGGEDDF
ncbi:hypothetical protein COT40_00235 [Candidatus Peregrinibacteria bacterium CG08_land_8_20_14_0_20_41_10]|nr:MAG: hypothetical protein AUJ78_00200 [Candidatus Peregrinibacteria bacterium CG1_02_41_10]PIS32397.1 MAG: hypothetical protein COT40_00235 [Candidatus Peregrinibacteria bacterium CG08_land_8_20_14_0_20_41_10]